MDVLIFGTLYLLFLLFLVWIKYEDAGLDVWKDILDRSYRYRYSVLRDDKISAEEKIRLIDIESESYDVWVAKIWNVRKF